MHHILRQLKSPKPKWACILYIDVILGMMETTILYWALYRDYIRDLLSQDRKRLENISVPEVLQTDLSERNHRAISCD